jgi:general secretion pathway protein J
MSSLPSHLSHQRGFTLIEVLLAMALTALIGVLAYQGLSSSIAAMESQEAEVTRITDLQTAWRVIGNDLQQAAYREITDEDEETMESFLAGTDDKEILMEFTRSGWANPLDQRRSDLQRVRYVFENRQLWRIHWLTLDRLKEPEPVKLLLLDNVESVNAQFFAAKKNTREGGQWIDHWPEKMSFGEQISKTPGQQNPDIPAGVPQIDDLESAFPLAVKIKIDMDNWGSIERLYLLPESDE